MEAGAPNAPLVSANGVLFFPSSGSGILLSGGTVSSEFSPEREERHLSHSDAFNLRHQILVIFVIM